VVEEVEGPGTGAGGGDVRIRTGFDEVGAGGFLCFAGTGLRIGATGGGAGFRVRAGFGKEAGTTGTHFC